MTDQPLIADRPLNISPVEMVDLDSLPPNEELEGPEPSKSLLDSLRTHGVLLEPIIINKGEKTKVVSGRRRIKACRILVKEDPKWSKVPVRVMEETDRVVSEMVVGMHATRNENSAADVAAISAMMSKGLSDEEIAHLTGLNLKTVRKRQRLLSLIPRLWSALMEGRLRISIAYKACRLSDSIQETLADRFDQGKLTLGDAKAAKLRFPEPTFEFKTGPLPVGEKAIADKMFQNLGVERNGKSAIVSDGAGQKFLVELKIQPVAA